VLGRALAGRPRDSFVVATKVWAEMPNGDRGLSREQVLKQIDASLRRQLDHIDLYQAHSFDEDVPVEETLGAFTELVDAGKVRFVGVFELGRRADPPRGRARPRPRLHEDRLLAARVLAPQPRAGRRCDSRLARERHFADRLLAAR
jgi:hypothetical protein